MRTLLEIGLGNALAATGLALVVALAARLLRRRPAVVHGLWLVVLLKLVTPPLATIRVPLPTRDRHAPGAATVPAPAPPPAPVPTPPAIAMASPGLAPRAAEPPDLPLEADPTPPIEAREVAEPMPLPARAAGPGPIADRPPDAGPDPTPARIPAPSATPDRPRPAPSRPRPVATAARWAPAMPDGPTALAWAWGAGSIGWMVAALARLRRFDRRVAAAGVASAEVSTRVEGLARRIGLRRGPAVALIPGSVAPLVWAPGGRPRLLIPMELWARLDDRGRDALIVHELAHLRRGDHLVRWLEVVVGGLYWWLPTARWARRGLRRAEEECCDAWVVRALPESGRSYAGALIEALEFLSGPRPGPAPLPPMASGLDQFRDLSRRITMIMKGTTPPRLSLVGLLAVLVLAAVSLPWMPSLSAQAPAGPTTTETTPAATHATVLIEESSPEIIQASPTTPAPPTATIPAPGSATHIDPGPTAAEVIEMRPIRPAPDPVALDDARDAVDLAEATRDAKRGAVAAFAAQLQKARGHARSVKQLRDNKAPQAVSQVEVEQANLEVDAMAGHLSAAQAELREAEIRVRQARRRLDRLTGSDRPTTVLVPVVPGGPTRMPSGTTTTTPALPSLPADAMPRMGPRADFPMPTAPPRATETIPVMPGQPYIVPNPAQTTPAPTKPVRILPSGGASNAPTRRGPAFDFDPIGVNRMKLIGLALQNYEQANGVFPPAAITGKDGRVLLSWRVAILPFLQDPTAKGLYERFHLDEPWDSPHNLPASMSMPEVFKAARPAPETPGHFTPYRGLAGPSAAFGDGPRGARVADVTDGTSNTLFVVQSAKPVPWSMPAEIDPEPSDLNDPRALIFGARPAALTLFMDGSVRPLYATLPDATLQAVMTRNGGEVIASDELEPGATPAKITQPARVYRAPAAPSEADRRIAELERKLDGLIGEIRALRRERPDDADLGLPPPTVERRPPPRRSTGPGSDEDPPPTPRAVYRTLPDPGPAVEASPPPTPEVAPKPDPMAEIPTPTPSPSEPALPSPTPSSSPTPVEPPSPSPAPTPVEPALPSPTPVEPPSPSPTPTPSPTPGGG